MSLLAKVAACLVLSAGLALLLVLGLSEQHSSTDALAFVLVPIYIVSLLAVIVFGDFVVSSVRRGWRVWQEIVRDEPRV
jgi:hypothetical protein